ncbi:MAG: phenylalanine--tRNA ligase subunit beta, partial [Myxococcales bacterium]
MSRLLGIEVPAKRSEEILTSLGFHVTSADEAASVEVPSWRDDVERAQDLIEEIARVHGYEKVPAVLPSNALETPLQDVGRMVEGRARVALAAAGFDEVVNYSFVAPRELSVLEPDKKPIALKNPLTAEQSVMRTTMLAGLLGNLRHSLNRQVDDIRLYELGRVYLQSEGEGANQPAREPRILAGVMYGHRTRLQWSTGREPIDFYDLKGVVEQIVEAAGIRDVKFLHGEQHALHPRSATRVEAGGRAVGSLGELHPAVAKALDLPRGVFAFQLDFQGLADAASVVPGFRGVPRFPAVLRDLAVVLAAELAAGEVAATIRDAGEGLVEDVKLFDVYRGENIPAGRKSMAF